MGRKPTDAEVLEKRGSWLAPARKKAEREAKRRAARLQREIPADIPPEVVLEAIKTLPGYDPYHKADLYEFDVGAACAAVDFFQQKLSHVKGELTGKAFLLEVWEIGIIANLFGWKHRETGYRRYREALVEVGRKNGKTPLAAGIILYLLFRDNEPGAEIYGAASEYKQASLVFAHAYGMRNQDEELEDNSKVFKGQVKSIEVGEPGDLDYGIYRVISSDAFSAHGFNTHGAVVDELHTQPNGELVDALLTSVGARRQPLIVYITTSDFEREGSVCNEKEDYAKKVRDGIVDDPTFLPVIYEASLDDDWKDEEVWKKANPNVGVSVSWEYLRRQCKRAQESPTFENTFKRLHLNIRTEQDVRWLRMEDWDACNSPVDAEELVGCECFVGLDLASTIDIAALVLNFKVDGQIKVLPFFWAPKEGARKREKNDRVPYLTWARQGHIKLTEGHAIDYDVIRADINELGTRYNIKQIAIDPWNATQLSIQLMGDGFEVLAFRQGFASMTAPSKELEKLILEGGLAHGGHPVLRWMASNVSAEIDAAGNIKPSKKTSTEKIDGIVALINSIGARINTPEKPPSVYETRGVFDPLAEGDVAQ